MSSSSSSSCTVSRRGTKGQIRFPREHIHRPGPPGFLEDRGTTFERSPIHIQDRNRSGKNGGSRFTPRSRAALSTRWTRVHAISRAGKWRNVRNKTLAGQRSGGGCAQGRLPLYYGDSGRVHTVLPRESKSPRVSAARTHGTHTQQGRPRPASRVLPPPPPQSSYFPGPWAPFTPTAPPRSD